MTITPAQFLEIKLRTERSAIRSPEPTEPAELEVGRGGLQEQIRDWCCKQWPPWKIIQARSDRKSTIAKGAADMIIFAPGGKVFNIETKAKGNKPSPDQLVWAKELEMLGHTVHFVYSFEEFKAVVRNQTPGRPPALPG